MSFASVANWTPAVTPGRVTAVAARGAAARQLARSLLRREADSLARLRGVATLTHPSEGAGEPPLLVIVGEAGLLPWADGAVYLGHGEMPSRICWPVLWTPNVPVAALERAMVAAFPELDTPLALVPQWQTVVPLGGAMPLESSRLQEFLRRHWRHEETLAEVSVAP